LGSGTPSDLLVPIAGRIALGALVLVGVMAVQIFLIRALRERRERRRLAVRARWEPLLLGAVGGDPPAEVPRLARWERETFLLHWNRVQETLAGPVRDRLADLARRAGADAPLRRWMRRRAIRRKLLAIQTAGNLRDEGSVKALQRILRGPRPFLSLCAARALVQIDPALAGVAVVPLVAGRPDWPFARLAQLLRGARPESFSGALALAALAAPTGARPRMARLLAEADGADALPVLRKFLDWTREEECAAACLHSLARFRDPADLPRFRARLGDPAWIVRMHAAAALGPIGTPEDEPALRALLGDAEWWVRYRAAGALLRLPGMDSRRAAVLRGSLAPGPGREVLDQVLAESGGS
jgi:HEAT repeat protein